MYSIIKNGMQLFGNSGNYMAKVFGKGRTICLKTNWDNKPTGQYACQIKHFHKIPGKIEIFGYDFGRKGTLFSAIKYFVKNKTLCTKQQNFLLNSKGTRLTRISHNQYSSLADWAHGILATPPEFEPLKKAPEHYFQIIRNIFSGKIKI